MAEEKYGLIEDLDKFIETQGTDGVVEPEGNANETEAPTPAPAPEPPVPVPAEPEPTVPVPAEPAPPTTQAEINIEEHEAYKALLAKNAELEAKTSKEINPKLKEIEAWAERTKQPIENWPKFQEDPADLSDLDVVRKTQRLKNPSLSEEELEFYIRDNFISDEDEDDERTAMRKTIAFKKEVDSGKKLLEENRLKFDTVLDTSLTPEQQADLELAQQYRENDIKSQKDREEGVKALRSVISKTDKIPLNLAEGKVLDFNIPIESKKDQEVYLSEMKRWENPDGTVNREVMLSDSYVIRHLDDIVTLAYQQGKNDQLESSVELNSNIVEPSKQHKTVSEGNFGFIGRGGKRRKQV